MNEDDFNKVLAEKAKQYITPSRYAFQEGFRACLELVLLEGLPSDMPSVPLELKRAYQDIDQLEAKISSLKDWREKWKNHNIYPEDKWEEFDLALADVEVIKK